MDFNKTSDKLSITLQSFLSLHEAGTLHNMIIDDKYTEDDCVYFINDMAKQSDDDGDEWIEKHIK